MTARIVSAVCVATAFALSVSASAPAYAECSEQFDGTFDLIQTAIFQRHGCTSSFCHDSAASGGLDLSQNAYDHLVDQLPGSVSHEQYPGLRRVLPGRKDESLLWLNLASATLPELWHAPLRPMPLGFAPLSFEELDVIRMWIEEGAPREGTVPGTGEAIGACLPPLEPLHVEPLPPPDPSEGVQIRAPRQILAPNSERETCFVAYYDLTDVVPQEFRGPNGDTFRFRSTLGRQDPMSHHAVTIVYKGKASIHDSVWGPFTCKGGANDGQSCDPTDLAFCGEGICGSEPRQAVACIGYGPGDASIGTGTESLFNTMAAPAPALPGVYDEAPLKGILVWNSHAFNVTDSPAELNMWINFEYAPPQEQKHPLKHFVDIDAIAKMDVPPYGVDHICSHHVVPSGASVLDLSSHMHKRGKRFRIFEGSFSCEGGPADGEPCSPISENADYPVADLCQGAPCTSRQPPRCGDCNADLEVSIDELLGGLNIALGRAEMDACPRFDANGDGAVSVDEVVAAVDSSLHPRMRDPADSLLYTSVTYADPLVLTLDPPLYLGGANSTREERTLTYCAVYDNGYSNPDEVKRRSLLPINAAPCAATYCAQGRVGEPCSGTSQSERDRSCDLEPGDGMCDACAVRFGVTTDDEMFVLAGSYAFD